MLPRSRGAGEHTYSFAALGVVAVSCLIAGYAMHSVWLSSLSREKEISSLTKDVANLEARLHYLRQQTEKSAIELKEVQDLIATQRDLKKRLGEVTKARVQQPCIAISAVFELICPLVRSSFAACVACAARSACLHTGRSGRAWHCGRRARCGWAIDD